MTTATGSNLVGRESELARLHRFIDDIADGPCGAVISGDAGIGKTALWQTGVEAAEASGVRILTTRCAEAEMPLALGGLADLLDGALEGIADDLVEPQRRALAVAVGLEAPSAERPDAVVLPRAFLACLRALAGRSRVLLTIDDVQWLDPPSQRILAFAVRRLRDAPVGVLVTQRGDAGDPLGLRHHFDERFTNVRVGPLSVGALHHLVRTRLGARIPRPALARVHEESGGNPMFALEFAKSVASTDGPLPLPSSLEELVRERVAAFPPDVLPLLAVVAATIRPTPAIVEAVVDGSATLLETASAAGAVTVDAEGIVRFTHPLLAAAAYAAAAPAARRALHARLAIVSGDADERARHRALATVEPDAETATLIDEAAVRARARGAPDAAATLARHALRVTPVADVAGREQRALALADYLADSGQIADARRLLRESLATGLSGARRARALLVLFQVEDDVEKRGRIVEEALDHAGDDRGLRARALLLASKYRLNRGETEASEELAREALAEAEQVVDLPLLATALSTVAARSLLRGRPEPALLERAIVLAAEHGVLARATPPQVLLAEQRLFEGDLAGARELLSGVLEEASSNGREHDRVLMHLAEVELAAGNWGCADQLLDQASELAFDGGDRLNEAWACLRRAELAALRGDTEEARELAHQGIKHGEAIHWPFFEAANRWVLGFLELSLGQPGRAWPLLADTGEFDLTWAENAAADGVEALVALGRIAEAEALVRRLEAHAAGNVWTTATALRCRALVLLA
ncbi:MAG: AAA family ATPase, partial [Gaiellaceae bacterium]